MHIWNFVTLTVKNRGVRIRSRIIFLEYEMTKLASKLFEMADQVYEARYQSKQQLGTIFAHVADLKGLNEANIAEKINNLVQQRLQALGTKDLWNNQVPNETITEKQIKDKQAENKRIEAAFSSFDNFVLRANRKWRLDDTIAPDKGSMLVVDSDATVEDIIEVHKFLNVVLCHNVWYQLATIEKQEIDAVHPISSCKILGQYDKADPQNPNGLKISGTKAVDAVPIIVMPNGHIKCLAIKRPSGEWALNGGMVEQAVVDKLATIISEFLEEVISGSLFDQEYQNNLLANESFNKLSQEERHALIKNSSNISAEHVDLIANILAVEGDFSEKFANLIARKSEFELSDFDFDHLVVSLKVQLFKTLCKDQYDGMKAALANLIKNSKINLEPSRMRSDPRATPVATVTTSPFVFALKENELKNILNAAGVGIKAGDDAAEAKVIDFSNLVDGFVFADHPSIVMTALAKALQEEQIVETEYLRGQVASMKAAVETRQEYLNDQVYQKIDTLYRALVQNGRATQTDMQAFHKLLTDAQSATISTWAMLGKIAGFEAKLAQPVTSSSAMRFKAPESPNQKKAKREAEEEVSSRHQKQNGEYTARRIPNKTRNLRG